MLQIEEIYLKQVLGEVIKRVNDGDSCFIETRSGEKLLLKKLQDGRCNQHEQTWKMPR